MGRKVRLITFAAATTVWLVASPSFASQATMRAAPPNTKPPAPAVQVKVTEEDLRQTSERAKKADEAASALKAYGHSQEAVGAAIKKDKQLPGPARNSVGDKTINAGKKAGRVGGAASKVAKTIDNGAKALNGDVAGLTENAIEEGVDRVAERLCLSSGPASPACKAWYELNKMAGRKLDSLVKEKTGTSLRDRVTDGYYNLYEYATSDDARWDYLSQRTGVAPEQLKAEHEATMRQQEKTQKKKGGDCNILQDPARSRELADRDTGAWIDLQNRCL